VFGKLRPVAYDGDMNFEPKGEPLHKNTIEVTVLVPERIVEMEARAS
jgi:hypothetical protein